MVNLVDLPYLCLKTIFKQLDTNSIFNCKLVCKTFKLFSDEQLINTLIVSDEVERARDVWFHTALINCTKAITVDQFVVSLSPELELNLKCLHLKIDESQTFDLTVLNTFNRLKQLHLQYNLSVLGPGKLPPISLPNLQVCEFSSSDFNVFQNYLLVLNAPRLAYLKNTLPWGLYHMWLEHPHTIKHLEVERYLDLPQFFSNLSSLQINNLLHVYDKDILTSYRRLQVLNVNFSHPKALFSDSDRDSLDYMRYKAKRMSVAINVNGLPFTEDIFLRKEENQSGLFESLHRMNSESLALLIKHYDRLWLAADLSFVTEIDFNNLMSLVRDKLPVDFFKRFYNIRTVKTSRQVNANEFVRFLSNLKCLEELNLSDSCLSQYWLNQLPNVCGQIVRFKFWHYRRLPINFDFVFRFPLLIELSTNKAFSMRWVVEAMKKLPNLKLFHVDSQNPAGDLMVKMHRLKSEYRYEYYFFGPVNAEVVRPTVPILCENRTFRKDQAGLDEMIAFGKKTEESHLAIYKRGSLNWIC